MIRSGLEHREGDIIMRIPFLDDNCQVIYLFLLLEFQSTEDQLMALRFGTYAHLLYKQLVREGRLIDGRLPPIFPLLLYKCDNHWNAGSINQLYPHPSGEPTNTTRILV